MRCSVTGLSVSYAYKKNCRCTDCRDYKAESTAREGEKARQRAREWARNNPNRMKEFKKKSADKKWIETRGELLEIQQGLCAICSRSSEEISMSNSSTRLHLDHDHKTNKNRGLLCGNCNIGLGHFKDNVELLQAAIDYLRRNGG